MLAWLTSTVTILYSSTHKFCKYAVYFLYMTSFRSFVFLPYPLRNKSCLTTFTLPNRDTSNGANDGQHEKPRGRNLALHWQNTKKQEGTVSRGKLKFTGRYKKQTTQKHQIIKYQMKSRISQQLSLRNRLQQVFALAGSVEQNFFPGRFKGYSPVGTFV